jgi:hypothetical protein
MFSTAAKPAPTANPTIAASTRKATRDDRALEDLFDDGSDVPGKRCNIEVETRREVTVGEQARKGRDSAAYDQPCDCT